LDPDDNTPWEPILNTIHKKLLFCERLNPTILGKHLLIQAIIGGQTQYLTMAQGMPKHIEETIIKMIKNFIWGQEAQPRITLDYLLHSPLDNRGINLLNIKARNNVMI